MAVQPSDGIETSGLSQHVVSAGREYEVLIYRPMPASQWSLRVIDDRQTLVEWDCKFLDDAFAFLAAQDFIWSSAGGRAKANQLQAH